jgi:hypothetical protein
MRSLSRLAFCHCSRDVKQYLAQPFTIASPASRRAKHACAYQILLDTLRAHAKVHHGPRLRLWIHHAGDAGRHRSVRVQFGGNRFCAEKMAELEHAIAQAYPALRERYKSEE